VKINWYWLVPLIQAYILMAIYIALFGLRLNIPIHHTALFIACGSALTSTALFHIIKMNTAYKKPRRVFPTTSASDFAFKMVCLWILLFAVSLPLMYADYTVVDCLSRGRCWSQSLGVGFPGYSGSLFVPMFFSGMGATCVNFFIFATLPMEEKSDGSI
jgi:hypothetical protein